MSYYPLSKNASKAIAAIALLLAIGLSASPAQANVWPPMAVVLFPLPFFASMVSFGIGLVLIILLEAFILAQRESVSTWKAIVLVAQANLISTAAGFVIIIVLTAIPYVLYGTLIRPSPWSLLAWIILGFVFFRLGTRTVMFLHPQLETHKTRRTNLFHRRSTWSIIWGVILIADLFLIGLVINLPGLLVNIEIPYLVRTLRIFGSALHFVTGFFFSVVIEGAWLQYRLPKHPTLKGTILVMNIRSYSYIVVPITIFLLLK